MTESLEMQQPSHTAQIDALFKAMEAETRHYENSLSSLKDVRLHSSLNAMLEEFAKLPLTPADKMYADQNRNEALVKTNELQDRVSQLDNMTNGKDIIDPLQTYEYEQALLEGDNKKAAKLEAAARQLRIDRHTAAQQIKALMPALTEAKQTANHYQRIYFAVRKSLLLQELQANQIVFSELLERMLPLWAEMNRLCVEADLKADHLHQLKSAFNLPQYRLQLAPGLEQVMNFELQRRPYF